MELRHFFCQKLQIIYYIYVKIYLINDNSFMPELILLQNGFFRKVDFSKLWNKNQTLWPDIMQFMQGMVLTW